MEWIVADLPPNMPMPGTKRRMLKVGSFSGNGYQGPVWTELEALNAAELLTLYTGEPLTYAFRRMRPRSGQCAHCAGLAFHIGRGLSKTKQNYVLRYALEVCGFDFAEPVYRTMGYIHAEKRVAQPANLIGGFPNLHEGNRGAHVMTLQQALILNEIYGDALTGIYTRATKKAVTQFQKRSGISPSGEVCEKTWAKLLDERGKK